MKVLMISRPNLFTVRGGDTIQVIETASYLRKLGVLVDIDLTVKIDYTRYDLVHFFNLTCPEDIIGHLKKIKIPFVVSTIYIDYSEYDTKYRKSVIGFFSKFLSPNAIAYFKTLGKFLFKNENVSSTHFFLKGHKKTIKYIIENTSMLLPNSHNEYKRIERDFGIEKKHTVIPNAINKELFVVKNEIPRERIVICVARIEGNKNQLNLIKAVKNLDLKLFLIGDAAPNQMNYLKLCKAEANENVFFIPHMKQDDLLHYYAKAKVHVLPSWFETTGLSSLEAASMGCNIVVGDRGDVRDYFKNYANYCNPEDVNSIRNEIINALEKPFNPEFKNYILSNYTWEIAAQKTVDAYKSVLYKQ